jgi:hypothetical protein
MRSEYIRQPFTPALDADMELERRRKVVGIWILDHVVVLVRQRGDDRLAFPIEVAVVDPDGFRPEVMFVIGWIGLRLASRSSAVRQRPTRSRVTSASIGKCLPAASGSESCVVASTAAGRLLQSQR